MAPALSKVAAGSSSQPPKAASEPDCTAKHADAADCSDKVMAAQWRKRAGRVLFPEVLPVCNGRRQACERPLDGLRSPQRVSTHMRATLPPAPAVVYERFASGTCRYSPGANWRRARWRRLANPKI